MRMLFFIFASSLLFCAWMISFVFAADECTITWTANTEKDLADYRIYARPQGALAWGTPRLTVPKSVTRTMCTAFTVPISYEGRWEFVATARDTSTNESAVSAMSTKDFGTKIPAVVLISPLSGAVLLPGTNTWEWTKSPGAIAYELFVHQDGLPYFNPDGSCSDGMVHCGKVMGTKTLVDLAPSSKYDFWIVPIGSTGQRGDSQGGVITTKPLPPPPVDPPPLVIPPPPVTPPPPPPTVTLQQAIQRATDRCIALANRSILKCAHMMSEELKKVTP